MNLEINKNHKKINLSKISTRNKIFSSLMATSLSLVLFSGCAKSNDAEIVFNDNEPKYEDAYQNNVYSSTIQEQIDYSVIKQKIESINNNSVINVPNFLKKYIIPESDSPYTEEITKEQLESLTTLSVSCFDVTNPDELLWLNYCINLESLNILIFNDDILNEVIDLPNLQNLSISNYGNTTVTLNKNNSGILTSGKLSYLKLTDINVEKDLLEALDTLKTLDLSDMSDFIMINYDVDYSDLDSLRTIIISNPYSFAARLSMDELTRLMNSSISIKDTNNRHVRQVVKDICVQMDSIISNLDIPESLTEEQKFELILMYVLNTLQYNEEIDTKSRNHTAQVNDVKPFYNGGYLYGALENDTQICGNYAAFVTALCDKFNIESYVTVSSSHAWNLVYLDGSYYYVDSTFMDNELKGENTLENVLSNEWYLSDPLNQKDRIYSAINIPDIVHIVPIEEPQLMDNNVEDITNQKYEVSVGTEKYILSASALIGLLGSLGYAYNKKKKDMIIKTEEQQKTR